MGFYAVRQAGIWAGREAFSVVYWQSIHLSANDFSEKSAKQQGIREGRV
jgi:hypothetical protein